MALTTTEKLQEAFSLALEDRDGTKVEDLVSNSNAIWYQIKKTGQMQAFSGPTIRIRLRYTQSGTYTRYSGADFLNTARKELINDAEFEPKLGAVSIVLTNEDILKNSGRNQLINVMSEHIDAGKDEIVDRFVEDLHSAGALSNQIGGLQKAIPTDPTSGTYGGISRASNTIWRTNEFDMANDFGGDTAFNSTTAHRTMLSICTSTMRGNTGPDDIYMDANFYEAYSNQLLAIQRIQSDGGGLAGAGFTSMKWYGAGRSMDVVLEGGIGTAMPTNTAYFINRKGLAYYYHPDRNFQKFGGKQSPINQDMVVQHIGFMGELVLKNPIHMSKLYTT